MANALHRTTKRTIHSIDLTELPGNLSEWIVFGKGGNPNVAHFLAMHSIPQRYRKVVGDDVSEMDQAEKDVVDDQILADRITSEKDGVKARYDDDREIIALMKLLLNRVNRLEQNAGIPLTTPSQLRTAYRNEVNSG